MLAALAATWISSTCPSPMLSWPTHLSVFSSSLACPWFLCLAFDAQPALREARRSGSFPVEPVATAVPAVKDCANFVLSARGAHVLWSKSSCARLGGLVALTGVAEANKTQA